MATQSGTRGLHKTMRKGTRSCYECRKRKVRCVFPKDLTVCESCVAGGKKCIEQRRELVQAASLDSRESLRDRVARLEATIQASASSSVGAIGVLDQATSVLHRLEVDGSPRDARPREIGFGSSSSSFVGNPTPASPLSPDTSISLGEEASKNIDPIVTLFDNAIWKRRITDLSQERVPKAAVPGNSSAEMKSMRTRELLLSDLIAPELVMMIVNAACSWWHTWSPLGPWLAASIGDTKSSTLPDFVLWAIDSDNPAIVGIAMLCVAICLQQLDPRVHQYIVRQLPRSTEALFQAYFEKVDRLIVSDVEYSSTEEGIDALMLSAKIYMNLGLLRKCWVLTHQAITYSQLLGFHRPERQSESETEAERYRRNQLWLSLCSWDVYSSLLLGLPYAADGHTIPVTHSQRNATALLQHNLIFISAEIIDRNQRGLSLSVSRTEDIQKQLEDATRSCDTDFWNSPTAWASGKIARPEYLEQIICQCWFYHLVVTLHMPLMIHSVENIRLKMHRTACLEAARNFLKVYHTMRSDTFSAFGMVKVIDYQAFVCSALLILGLLGYGSSTQEAMDRNKDRDLIGLTVGMLRQASGTVNNPIASQAVQGLETLMFLGSDDCPQNSEPLSMNPHAKVVVPYVGTITITPGEYFTNPRPESTLSTARPLFSFSLSHDSFHETSGPGDQPPRVTSSIDFDNEQANGSELWANIHLEEASIDFDWAHTIAPNLGDDWAWLNDMKL